MQFNLENRPRPNHLIKDLQKRLEYHSSNIAVWFEGFEKELRKIIEWKGTPLKPEWIEQIKGQKKLAKEILGE